MHEDLKRRASLERELLRECESLPDGPARELIEKLRDDRAEEQVKVVEQEILWLREVEKVQKAEELLGDLYQFLGAFFLPREAQPSEDAIVKKMDAIQELLGQFDESEQGGAWNQQPTNCNEP